MSDNEFRQPICVDFAPEGRLCEWCGKPAVHQLTAIGGNCHNEEEFFCQAFNEEFVRTVADSLSRVITADTNASMPV
jgi:hypothetical protein